MTKTLPFRVSKSSKSNVQRTGPTAPSRRSVRDRCVIERYVALPAERVTQVPKFHLVPENGWDDHTRKLRCGMSNVIEWDGALPLPAAPSTPCWLLPAKDDMAVCISRLQQEILAAGWKVSPARSAGWRGACRLTLPSARAGLDVRRIGHHPPEQQGVLE